MARRASILTRIGAALAVLRSATGLAGIVEHFRQRRFGGSTVPTRPYSQVAVVHACVKARAEALGGMPLTISTGDDQVIETGPLAELAECPNPAMTGRAFWQATSAILDLFGSCFWVKLLDGLGRPVEVYPVSPLQVEPIRDKRTNAVTAWKYRPAGRPVGQEETLALEEVHPIVDPDFENPHDPLVGLSPRAAVTAAINQYFKADIANESSLDNGVEPGGALHTDRSLSDEQRDQVKQVIYEQHAGVRNRRRFLLLEGGLKWERIGAAFSEMEFSELKKMSRADICAGYNTPGPVVNYFEDSNYAHADSAQQSFWTNTVVPRGARLAEEWELAVLTPYEGDRSLSVGGARLSKLDRRRRCCGGCIVARRAARRSGRSFSAWFDSSGVPAVQRAALAVTDQAHKLWSMGTPINHLYAAFDLPFPEVPYGDVGYKPIGLEAYGTDTLDTIDDPDGATPEPGLIPEDDDGRGVSPSGGQNAVILRASEQTRSKLWALWRKSWMPLERKMDERVRGHFFNLRSETLANLDRVKNRLTDDAGERSVTPNERRNIIGSILFDIQPANRGLIARVGPLVREAYRLGGAQSMQEAADARGTPDDADPFNIEDPLVQDKMRRRTVKATGVNRTMRRRLSKSLAEGLDAGESADVLAERIKGEFNFARSRAKLIAQTEVGAAVEEARHEGRKQAGVPMKSWLHSRKETGRLIHQATERVTLQAPVAADEDFTLAGTTITCPHPRATGLPEHDINCGCTTLARFPGDSLKSVLARYTRRGFLTYDQLTERDGSDPTRKDANHAHAQTLNAAG